MKLIEITKMTTTTKTTKMTKTTKTTKKMRPLMKKNNQCAENGKTFLTVVAAKS